MEQNLESDLLKRQRDIEAGISKLNAQLINERAKEPGKQDKQKIKGLEEELSKADVEHANWLRELRRRCRSYADLKYPEPLTLEQAQRSAQAPVRSWPVRRAQPSAQRQALRSVRSLTVQVADSPETHATHHKKRHKKSRTSASPTGTTSE